MDDFEIFGDDFREPFFNWDEREIDLDDVRLSLSLEISYGTEERAKTAFDILRDGNRFRALYNYLATTNFEG